MLTQTAVPEIMNGVTVIRRFSADDEMRFLAQRREKAIRDEISALDNAEQRGIQIGIVQGREEGIAQGIVRGREEGRAEGRTEGIAEGEARKEAAMIARMKASGMTDERIKEILSLKI